MVGPIFKKKVDWTVYVSKRSSVSWVHTTLPFSSSLLLLEMKLEVITIVQFRKKAMLVQSWSWDNGAVGKLLTFTSTVE